MLSNFKTIGVGLVATLATRALAASSEDPCAQISEIYAQGSDYIHIGSEDYVHIPAQLAVDCLTSMPFESDKAVAFIDEYSKYLEFQSDLEMLAKPPASYQSNRVDLRAGIQGIRSYASQGLYSNQFQFDSDITDLINSANDGHLAVQLCSTAFVFAAPDLVLVSVSVDGVTAPQLYTIGDAELLAAGVTTVSNVAYINGVGGVSTIESQSAFQLLQDPDARYNDVLSNLVYDGQGTRVGNTFTLDTVWRGIDSYNVVFANQSSKSYEMVALFTAGDFNYTSGKDLYEGLCGISTGTTLSSRSETPPSPSGTPSPSASASASVVPSKTATFTPPPTTYPTPVIREPHNFIVGYYPDEPGLEDVAVLGVPTFETTDDQGLDQRASFAETAQYFVGNATLDGKKKIIIDVQNNGGGTVDSGFALFSVFFPNETLYSATRLRAHDAMNFIGTIYNAANDSVKEQLEDTSLIVDGLVKPDQQSTFSDWKEFFGPYNAGGIPSTALNAEFKFADEANPIVNPINTDGLGGDLDSRTPPFAPEDIVVLTDGRCSSTCTIFTDHMISKGVKTVAMGGRPRPEPMQAIGGVKGSQVVGLSQIDSFTQIAVGLLNDSISAGNPLLSQENITRFADVIPSPLESFPLPLAGGSVNYRNTYTTNDDSTPTQFVYEAATCHLFYIPQTVVYPAVTWAQAANATWGSGSCVGGIQADNSIGSQSLDDDDDASTESDSVSSPGTHRALGLLLALGAGMN